MILTAGGLGLGRAGAGGQSPNRKPTAQATGANVHTLCAAVNHYANPLHIGVPKAVALPVGVADLMAVHSALFAYFTEFSHFLTPPLGINA